MSLPNSNQTGKITEQRSAWVETAVFSDVHADRETHPQNRREPAHGATVQAAPGLGLLAGSTPTKEEACHPQAMLACILDFIIPESSDGRLPSASTVMRDSFFIADQTMLIANMRKIDQTALSMYAKKFIELGVEQQQSTLNTLSTSSLRRFFVELAVEVARRYYRDPRVLSALGVGERPPFPLGYSVPEGDWLLLEPVFERGPIFRNY